MASSVQDIALAVLVDRDRVLIGRRPAGVPLAGLWEFPGGKVRPGELPPDAVVRECREETGLTARVGRAYPVVEYAYEHASVRLHCYACTPVDGSREPAPPFRWVLIESLGGYEFPAANRQVLQQLVQSAFQEGRREGKESS